MNQRTVNLFTFILFSLYIVCCMLLVSIGISVYRNVRENNTECDSLRLSICYIENKLRGSDIAGAVSLERRDDTDVLVIKYDGENDCETLIYYKDGSLYEMFKFSDYDISLDYGTKLCEVKKCSMNLESGVFTCSATDSSGNEHKLKYTLSSISR